MNLGWLVRGLRTGIVTTRYPRTRDALAGTRGAPLVTAAACADAERCRACVESCLPGALRFAENEPNRLELDYGACITCGLCVHACPTGAIVMTGEVELAVRERADLVCEVNDG